MQLYERLSENRQTMADFYNQATVTVNISDTESFAFIL